MTCCSCECVRELYTIWGRPLAGPPSAILDARCSAQASCREGNGAGCRSVASHRTTTHTSPGWANTVGRASLQTTKRYLATMRWSKRAGRRQQRPQRPCSAASHFSGGAGCRRPSPVGPAPGCWYEAPAAPAPRGLQRRLPATVAMPAWRTAGTASCRSPWETPAARAGPALAWAGREAAMRHALPPSAVGSGPAPRGQQHPGIRRHLASACLLQRLNDLGHVVQLAGVGFIGEVHLHAAAQQHPSWKSNAPAGGRCGDLPGGGQAAAEYCGAP
jgi:hypothetical protein